MPLRSPTFPFPKGGGEEKRRGEREGGGGEGGGGGGRAVGGFLTAQAESRSITCIRRGGVRRFGRAIRPRQLWESESRSCAGSYNVIHEDGVFDLVDGVLDRNLAYDFSEAAVTEILEQYPSIEIVIDLHRDGVDGTRFVTEYNGKPAAQLMFIAGMSRTADGQDIAYLPNPYIQDNLAFALQLQLAAEEETPELMRNIYLMAYRFNLHLRPKSLLLEAGTQLSTVAEEKKRDGGVCDDT